MGCCIQCYCTFRGCNCGGPIGTTCIEVQAKDVRAGDYLDTRDFNGRGLVARVVARECIANTIRIHAECQRAQTFRDTERAKVWRASCNEAESLRATITEQQSTLTRQESQAAEWRRRALRAETALNEIRRALR